MDVEVRFPTVGRSVRVPAGTALIDAVRGADLPIASACGGDGLCGRCGVEIKRGSVDPETREETRAKQRNRIAPRLRLACRIRLDADVSVSAPYW